MKARVKSAVASHLARLSAPFARPVFGGIGSILMLHRITEPPCQRRIGWCHQIEATMEFLVDFVKVARNRGYEFVSLDALHDRLVRKRFSRRCVVVTFDDGYLDVLTVAYPFLKQCGIPFTVYVTTGFPDRTVVPWWYLAERHLSAAQPAEIGLDDGGTTGRIVTHADRQRAFTILGEAFDKVAPDQEWPLAARLFGEEKVNLACEELILSWDHVRQLAGDPLVTIGAHTLHHRNLLKLSQPDVVREIEDSRRLLADRLGTAIDHFAYPFGSCIHAGPREFALAKECGFKTAVTTRVANIFPGHAAHLEALPRVYAPTVQEVDRQMSGAVSALRYRKRVVFDD